jgi:hypothetical protein
VPYAKQLINCLKAFEAADIREGTFYLYLSTHVEITAAEKGQIFKKYDLFMSRIILQIRIQFISMNFK